jgi:hypothetical protein
VSGSQEGFAIEFCPACRAELIDEFCPECNLSWAEGRDEDDPDDQRRLAAWLRQYAS